MATTFTVNQLLNPPTYDAVKDNVYNQLILAGFTSIRSYAPESLSVCLVETESASQDAVNQAAKSITEAGYNDLATGEALDRLSSEVYQDERYLGAKTIGRITLALSGSTLGPYSFSPLSISVSTGVGGKVFNGIVPNAIDPVTINNGGTAFIYVEASEVGASYNVSASTINTFTRGKLAGVSLTNAVDWLTQTYSQQGVNPEADASLRRRNQLQWETLSQYKATTDTPGAYESMARNADPQVTRVSVLTNLDLTDPGRVDVIIAGTHGALGSPVVATVQAFIAPAQTGGSKIPETAKCVVTSAINLNVTVSGVVIVDPAYNNQGFLDTINANLQTWFTSFLIGGGKLAKVSYDRIVGIVCLPAATTNAVIFDCSNLEVNGDREDLDLDYNEVPVLTSTLTLRSI